MDVLGFKDFKTFYGDVLAKRAREGAGVLSKADFLVAIEEPFQLAFTPERIKKSFALVGLHPYNPDAITPAMMAPSKATSSHTPLHINESAQSRESNLQSQMLWSTMCLPYLSCHSSVLLTLLWPLNRHQNRKSSITWTQMQWPLVVLGLHRMPEAYYQILIYIG